MSGIPAEHFTIHRWLELARDAVAQLPEFQRDFVWKPDRVAQFLDAILANRPVGCLLVLKVRPDGIVPFDPRPIEGAPPSSDRPIEYLILDGQQRITALWRALLESDRDRRYYIAYAVPNVTQGKVLRFPRRRWQDDPKKCLKRGLVPVALLRYTQNPDDRQHVTDWIDAALADDDGKAFVQKKGNYIPAYPSRQTAAAPSAVEPWPGETLLRAGQHATGGGLDRHTGPGAYSHAGPPQPNVRGEVALLVARLRR